MVFGAVRSGDLLANANLPRSTLAGDFVLNTSWPHASHDSLNGSQPIVVDPGTGRSYNKEQLRLHVEHIARGLSSALGWSSPSAAPRERVVGIYSPNSIDYLPLCWAIHRAGGVCLLLHTSSSVAEVEAHLRRAKCCCVFTTRQLIDQCSQAVASAGTPTEKIFLMDSVSSENGAHNSSKARASIASLSLEGQKLEPISSVLGGENDGDRIAFLCATSGTSGAQKLAAITHYNVIANTLQIAEYEVSCGFRDRQVALGILPQSHSYALITEHILVWRGDTIVLHPEFNMQETLKSIQQYRIERLYLVPPITTALVANPILFKMFDVSSVRSMISGGAPFPKELNVGIKAAMPHWDILAGYGLTETAVVVSMTNPADYVPGSSGSLIPGVQARLIDEDGQEIEEYGRPGEILFSSPSVMQGYLDDEQANKQIFESPGWLRTGDVGLFQVCPNGTEHLFVVDRLKDMIKVKGLQVAPIEIEDCLRTFSGVEDTAVIGISDAKSGERAKAFVVRSSSTVETDDTELKKQLSKHVEQHLPETHWLQGRIQFVDAIPRNQAGKTLKKVLRTW